MRDMMNNIHTRRGLSPSSVSDNTPQVTQIIDRQGFDSLTWLIALGALADADVTFTVLVEDGDDSGLSDAAAVADENLLGTEVLAAFQFDDDNETRKIGYVGGKRYCRLTITPANNASAANLCVIALLGHPTLRPTANPPQ